jgi:hypothetical protein
MRVVKDAGSPGRLGAATDNRGRLRRELDQRLEIIEKLKQKFVGL